VWSTASFAGGFKKLTPREPEEFGDNASDDEPSVEESDAPPPEPLILWEADEADPATGVKHQVKVDAKLIKWLRPHQREGLRFMFECTMGLRPFEGTGCILADDMGLGKTLQSIALLYTLLKQGLDGQPAAKKALIVCPTSLVSNWEDECEKWLPGCMRVEGLSEAGKEIVERVMNNFVKPYNRTQVLVVSYETFRRYSAKFKDPGACQLLICDEAHRLKNSETQTTMSLNSLPCLRRVLLSGTPMQNDLEEFFAMVDFTNPRVLGTDKDFRKRYQRPILTGREPDASEKESKLGLERSAELSERVNPFIMRRMNTINARHLPPKLTQIVCCKLSPLQHQLYHHFLNSKVARDVLTGKQSQVLGSIQALQKLVNHPKLICQAAGYLKKDNAAPGFEDCNQFFPPEMLEKTGGSAMSRAKGRDSSIHASLSGKMGVLERLLVTMRKKTTDRIVLISNFTSTLDLMQGLCREHNMPFIRLDGSCAVKKRGKMVTQFNDRSRDEFAFLLSSKAGGCGACPLRLILLLCVKTELGTGRAKHSCA
jgi:DNA repair and recombination RAD54-like protein